jgi:hypothetical protein
MENIDVLINWVRMKPLSGIKKWKQKPKNKKLQFVFPS